MDAPRRDTIWQQEAVAGWYRESVRGAIPFADVQLDVMLQFVSAADIPIRRFLDVGAGDGLLSAVLLSRYPRAEPILVDFSPSMLEAAAVRLRALTATARTIAADLATPAWREPIAALAPFDAIVSGFAIHHLPDDRKRALYGELLALLTPGGTFAHIEHVAPEAAWVRRAYDAGVIESLAGYASRRGEAASRDKVAATYFQRPDRAANILAPLDPV